MLSSLSAYKILVKLNLRLKLSDTQKFWQRKVEDNKQEVSIKTRFLDIKPSVVEELYRAKSTAR
jgi:hypothetical protein